MRKSPSILAPVRKSLGIRRITPNLVERVRNGGVAIEPLWNAVGEWGRHFQVPPIPDGEVRPFIQSRWTNQFHDGPIRVNRTVTHVGSLWRYLDGEPGNLTRVVDLIKYHLLYCHQVAIEDPIIAPVRYVSLTAPDDPLPRQRMASALQVIALLEPLIDAGIVVITPQLPRFPFDLHAKLGDYARQHIYDGGEDFLGPLEPELKAELRKERSEGSLKDRIQYHRASRLEFFSFSLAESFRVLEHYHQNVDLYLPSAAHRALLGLYIHHAGLEARQIDGWPLTRMEYLPALLSPSLPGLSMDRLSVNDIIAIRRDNVFETWYSALKKGLRQAESRSDALAYAGDAAMEDIRGELGEAARAARAEVQRSSVLRAARDGLVDLSISSGAGLSALALTGDPVSGVVVGGATIVLQSISKWLLGRASPGQKALLRHAALFEARSGRM